MALQNNTWGNYSYINKKKLEKSTETAEMFKTKCDVEHLLIYN